MKKRSAQDIRDVDKESGSKDTRLRTIQTLLNILSVTTSKELFLDHVVRSIQHESGCSCVGIRVLDDDGNVPYEAYIGFTCEFWEAENKLNILQDDCVCSRIVNRHPRPSELSAVNITGAFHCNDLHEFFAKMSAEEKRFYREACVREGHRSVAVIPIRFQGKTVGVIHLADSATGKLDDELIEYLESIAPLIGEFLQNDLLKNSLSKSQGNLLAEQAKRESAEQALQATREELQAIIDNVPDVVSRFDADLRYTFTNAAIEKATGRPKRYYLGKNHCQLEIQKPVYPSWDKCLRQVFATGQSTSLEFEHDHGAGARYYQVKFTPEFDANGKVKSVLTINRDITDRVLLLKRKEEALQAENRMLTNGPVVAFERRGGLGGSLAYVSPNARELTGYVAEDFLAGKVRFEDLVHPDDREMRQRLRSGIEEDVPFVAIELRFRRADGQYRWVYEHLVPLKDESGTLTGYRGYLFDITDRKNAERAIAESEQKYRELVEDANVIIMHLGEDGKILFINDFGLKFFNYGQGELLNRSVKDTILPRYESTGRDLWGGFDELVNNNTKTERDVIENIKKDGRRVWVKWTHRRREHPVTGEIRLITVGVDVTDRKRAETSLKRRHERERRFWLLNELLEKRIGQEEYIGKMAAEGIRLTPPVSCCLIVFGNKDGHANVLYTNEEAHARIETAVDLINAKFKEFACLTNNGIAVFLSAPQASRRSPSAEDERIVRIAETVRDVFREGGYVIGASGAQREIAKAFRQALVVSWAGSVFKPGDYVYHWDDLGVGQFLAEQVFSDTGREFVRRWLEPLCDRPTARNAELLKTLAALVDADTMGAAAQGLHIHPKTLAFRKRKIEHLLNLRLDDPETRVNLSIAIKLKQLQDK